MERIEERKGEMKVKEELTVLSEPTNSLFSLFQPTAGSRCDW